MNIENMNHRSRPSKLVLAISLIFLFFFLSAQRQISAQGTAASPIGVSVYLGGSAGSTLNFKVTLDSFTADLSVYKLDDMIVLRAEGKEYRPILRSEETSKYHRSAELEFNKPPHTDKVEVIARGIGGDNVRIFEFHLPEND
jgi:hypothetical protein